MPPLPDSRCEALLARVRQGDGEALNQLLAEHRGYLCRMVELRLDTRLRSRLDASDVVQDALVEATRRIGDYLNRQPMPFHLWLRQTTYQRLIDLRRHHLGAERRAAERELPLPTSSSLMLARLAVGSGQAPERALAGVEVTQRVQEALREVPEEDLEIILMRNVEELSNLETAQVLGITPTAASKRYGRALLRLRKLLLERGLTGSEL